MPLGEEESKVRRCVLLWANSATNLSAGRRDVRRVRPGLQAGAQRGQVRRVQPFKKEACAGCSVCVISRAGCHPLTPARLAHLC